MVGTVQAPLQVTPMPPEISGEILRKDGSSILGKGTYTKVGAWVMGKSFFTELPGDMSTREEFDLSRWKCQLAGKGNDKFSLSSGIATNTYKVHNASLWSSKIAEAAQGKMGENAKRWHAEVAAAKAKAIKDASAAAIAESAAKHKEAIERERRQAAQAEADRLAAEQIAQSERERIAEKKKQEKMEEALRHSREAEKWDKEEEARIAFMAERERAVAHISDAADRVYAKQGDRRQIAPPPQPVGTPPPDPLSGVESYPLSPATVSYPASADLAKVTAAVDEGLTKFGTVDLEDGEKIAAADDGEQDEVGSHGGEPPTLRGMEVPARPAPRRRKGTAAAAAAAAKHEKDLRERVEAYKRSIEAQEEALSASSQTLMEQREKASRAPRVIANGTSGSRSISPSMRGSLGPGTDNFLAAVRDISGGRPPPRENSRRSTGIETRGRTRNRVSHPGRGSIGGFAPLGTSLHARNSAFGLGNSDQINDIDAAGVFRGSAQSIRNSQSPAGVRIHAAEAGPVTFGNAIAGRMVRINRQFEDDDFCKPYVGQVGVLVSPGEADASDGWFVKWPTMGDSLHYMSTGGFGGKHHLEYATETRDARVHAATLQDHGSGRLSPDPRSASQQDRVSRRLSPDPRSASQQDRVSRRLSPDPRSASQHDLYSRRLSPDPRSASLQDRVSRRQMIDGSIIHAPPPRPQVLSALRALEGGSAFPADQPVYLSRAAPQEISDILPSVSNHSVAQQAYSRRSLSPSRGSMRVTHALSPVKIHNPGFYESSYPPVPSPQSNAGVTYGSLARGAHGTGESYRSGTNQRRNIRSASSPPSIHRGGMYASLRDAGAAAKSPRGSLMNRITTVGSPRSALPGNQAAGGLLGSPNKVRSDGLAQRPLKGDGPPQGRGVVVGSPTKGWGMRVPSGGTHRGVALIPQEWPEMPYGPSPSKVIDMRSTWSGMGGPPVVDPDAFKSSKSPSKAAGGGMRSTLGSVDDSGPSPSKVMDARATWGADDIGIMIGLSAVDASTAHSLGGSPDKKVTTMGGVAGEQGTVQQPTELDVVDGYYEGMPHFFDSVDHKGNHVLLCHSPRQGTLHHEWLVQPSEFEHDFLVLGMLIPPPEASGIAAGVARGRDGKIDCIGFLKSWVQGKGEKQHQQEREIGKVEQEGNMERGGGGGGGGGDAPLLTPRNMRAPIPYSTPPQESSPQGGPYQPPPSTGLANLSQPSPYQTQASPQSSSASSSPQKEQNHNQQGKVPPLRLGGVDPSGGGRSTNYQGWIVPDDTLDSDRSSLTSFTESDRGLVSGGSSFMDSTTMGGKTDRSTLTSENSSFMDANTRNHNTWGVSDMVRWVDGAGDKGGLPDGAGGARSESDTSMSVEASNSQASLPSSTTASSSTRRSSVQQPRSSSSAATAARGTKTKLAGLGCVFFPADVATGEPGRVLKRVKDGGPVSVAREPREGDRVVRIDGVEISCDLTDDKLALLILGRKGSVSTLEYRCQSTGQIKTVSLERFEAFDEAPPPARFGITPNPPLSAPLPPTASFPPNPPTPAQQHARESARPNPPTPAQAQDRESALPNPPTPVQHSHESSPPNPPTPAQPQGRESALPNPPTPANHHHEHESGPPLPPTPSSQPPPSPPSADLPPSAPSLPPPAPDALKQGANEARPPSPDRTAEAGEDEVDGGGSSRNGDGRQLFGLGVTFRKSDGKGGMVIKRVKPEGSAAIAGVLKSGDRVMKIDGFPLDDVRDAVSLSEHTHGVAGSVAALSILCEGGKERLVTIVR